MSAAISIENLVHRYKDAEQVAVNDISLEIKEGEIFGLLGPNGAGKTTTISILSGLLKPMQGKVTIHGFDVTLQIDESKKLIGVVPQEIALYPTLTANENLEFFGSMYGIQKAALKDKIKNYLNLFGLENTGKKRVEQFSGGMKRRLNLIASLLHDPKILILDEATSALDSESEKLVKEALNELMKNRTTFIIAHRLSTIREADVILVINKGKIVEQGTHDELSKMNDGLYSNLLKLQYDLE